MTLPDALQLNQRTLEEFSICCAQAPGGYVSEGDVVIACAGPRAVNRVLSARFADDNADRRISEVIDDVQARGGMVHWIVSPLDRPTDLGSRLDGHGFPIAQMWSCMDIKIADLSEPPELEGVEIRQVVDMREAAVWCRTVCRGFELPEVIHDGIREMFCAATFCDCPRLRHYLAYLDAVPVSGATVFNGSHAVGVHFVGTVPEARRRGLGLSVTDYAIRHCADWGHTTAVLQASTLGRPVYDRMGFVECGTMQVRGRRFGLDGQVRHA